MYNNSNIDSFLYAKITNRLNLYADGLPDSQALVCQT
jgi:hypothetical protein